MLGPHSPILLRSPLSCNKTPTIRMAVKRHTEGKKHNKSIRLVSTVLFFSAAVQLLASCRGSGRTAAGKYIFSIERSGKKALPLFHDQLF